MSFNQNSGTAVPTLINSSQVLVTGNAISANALTVRQFGTGNVFSASNASGTTALFVSSSGNVGIGTVSPATALDVYTGTMNAATVSSTTLYGVLAGSNTVAASTVSATSIVGTMYGVLAGSNTVAASTVSATSLVGTMYGVLAGSNTVAASTVSATSLVGTMYGVLAGSNTVAASTVSATSLVGTMYGVLAGSNTVAASTVSATSLVGTHYGVLAGSNTVAASTGYFSGNVGIGTASPVAPLSTFFATSGIPNTTGSGTSNVATRFQTGSVCLDMGNISNGNMWLQNHLDTNWATNYPLLLNPNGGFVGIGTTNPGYNLDVTGNVNVTGNFLKAGVPLSASQWTTLGSNIYFLSNVAIGATTVDAKYKLIVTGNVAVTKDVFVFYSDERLKTKIGSLENALDKVCSLEGFRYVPNDLAREIGATDDDRVRVGLSAQSVQRVLPEAVGPAPFNDQYLTVQYEKLVPLIVEAIKELRREVSK